MRPLITPVFKLTLNEQLAVFEDASVAVTNTVLVPRGNTEPEGGLPAVLTPGQLSDETAE
ncbi:MAG TPA: hypothetical protein VKH34_06245 [Vicinamibacterales bacterium]|nr:hypothetical protein [Vicinamibacterales bacterium]